MSINELKKLSSRELNKFMSKITAKEVKEILNNENLGGGLSKYNKDILVDILLDLIYETNESGLMGTLKPKKVKKSNKRKIKIEENKEDTLLETISKVAKDILENLVVDPEQYYEEYLEQHEEENERLEALGTMGEMMRASFFRNKILDMLTDKIKEVTKKSYIDYMFDDDANEVLVEESLKIGKVIHRQLAKYYHPDKATGDTEKFKNIQADYERFKVEIETFK